jgi:hypothetical protein
MLKGKGGSLKEQYDLNIRKMIGKVADDSYLEGLVEGVQSS